MKFCFELYLKSNVATKQDWQQFYKVLTAHIGTLKEIAIVMTIEENVVRYFVQADSDLGVLSNNIDIGVLRPAKDEECHIPETKTRERFVNLVTGGNLLDLREKLSMKRSKQLDIIQVKVRRVNSEKAITNLWFYFKNPGGHYTVNKKFMTMFPAHLFAVNFDENARYLKKEFPKFINIEKALPVLTPVNANALFAVNTFPYFAQDYFLDLQSYEFDKHSFIIGASGSGKSKFIELFVDRLSKSPQHYNYRVIVVDPHASLGADLQHIENSQVVDFSGNQSPELFGDSVQTDVSAATELTTTLMKSLLADQFNPKLERVLRFSLYVLFVSQSMSLGFLKRFVTELELRNQILKHVEGHVPDNIQKFFATDFNEIRTTYYNEAIQPIVAIVDEMQLQPGLVGESEQSLASVIQSNFLTVFSLNKVSMGEKVVKTVAGILIQQIFLLAQARMFKERVLLFIDEVSVVQSPALASILAEARKFNLFVILTQQYFGQVEKNLKDAIFANVYNYYVFRVSEEDAHALVGNLNIDLPKELVEEEHKKGVKEEMLKIKFMTELHPRECLIRVAANGQNIPTFKGRTLDIGSSEARPKVALESLEAAAPVNLPVKFVEGDVQAAGDVPSFPSSRAPGLEAAKPFETPDTAQLKEEVNKDSVWDQGPDMSLQFGGPMNPEAEISVFNNPEIDPEERRQLQKRQGQAATRVGSMLSKGHVTLEAAERTKVELIPVGSNSIDTDSGFGSGNLASILASQSSSRKLVNKRKAK